MAKKRPHRDAERARKPPRPGGPPARPPLPKARPKDDEPLPVGATARSEPDADEPEQAEEDRREERKPKPNGARKREVGVKAPPNLVIPSLAYVGFLVVCYVLGAFQLVSSRAVFPAFAVGSFAIVVYVAVAPRLDILRSRLGIQLVGAWIVVTALAVALPLAPAIFFGTPVAEKRITTGDRDVAFGAAPGRRYLALVVGHFPRLEERLQKDRDQPPAKDKRQFSYNYKGEATLALQGPDGREVSRFEGRYEALGQQRHLSKRASGFHEFQNATDRDVFRTPSGGAYVLRAPYLKASHHTTDGDRETPLELATTVYPWYGYPRAASHYLLAILAMMLGGVIDFLLKSKKVGGWFGLFTFGTGILIGFANYYLSEAVPGAAVNVYVFDLFIGGVLGLMVSVGILYGMDYGLKRLNRKYKVSL